MVAWFLMLALAGLWAVVHRPGVLVAVDPAPWHRLLRSTAGRAFVTLGRCFWR